MAKGKNDFAFPVPNDASVNGDTGLTKREWFAGMALQGLLARDPRLSCTDKVAKDAWAYADAVILWSGH